MIPSNNPNDPNRNLFESNEAGQEFQNSNESNGNLNPLQDSNENIEVPTDFNPNIAPEYSTYVSTESSYLARLRKLDPLNPLFYDAETKTFYGRVKKKTNPFALETFGVDPRTTEVDETFGFQQYDERSAEIALDRIIGMFRDRRYLPVHVKLPLDLTHRLNLTFRKKPFYGIISNSLPPEERPLNLLNLKEIRWLKLSLEYKEGDLVQKAKELAQLEARPVSYEVFVILAKQNWRRPLYLARLFLGYAKCLTRLQFWPFWASAEVKEEIRKEFVKRLIYKFSRKRTTDWTVFKQVIRNDIIYVSHLPIQREFVREQGIDDLIAVFNQKGIRENFLIYVAFNGLIYATFLSPWRRHLTPQMPIFASPAEHVEWETLRTQEESGNFHKALDNVVRVEISHNDVVMELTHGDHMYHAYWGNSRPSKTIQAISTFQPRESRLNLSLDPFSMSARAQNLDENLDEFPSKLASHAWLSRSREFVNAANVKDHSLPAHRIHSLASSTHRFNQLQQTPAVVPQTQWLETWFADDSDDDNSFVAILNTCSADRVMSGYRYPDMETDQIRFLWLRQFLFRAKNVRRRVRTKIGVYRTLPRFQPTLAPIDMQKPSSRGFSNTLVQWLAFLANEGDISYAKLPTSLMNLDILNAEQWDIDELNSLTPTKWEETHEKPLFDILQMPVPHQDQAMEATQGIDDVAKERFISSEESSEEPTSSIEAAHDFLDGMHELEELVEAGFVSDSLFHNFQRVVSSANIQLQSIQPNRLVEDNNSAENFQQVLVDFAKEVEETREETIRMFQVEHQVELGPDLQPLLDSTPGMKLKPMNRLLLQDQQAKAQKAAVEQAALDKVLQAKNEKLAARKAMIARHNKILFEDQNIVQMVQEFHSRTFESEKEKAIGTIDLLARMEARKDLLDEVRIEMIALKEEQEKEKQDAIAESQAKKDKSKNEAKVKGKSKEKDTEKKLTKEEKILQKFSQALDAFHTKLEQDQIGAEGSTLILYAKHEARLANISATRSIQDGFLLASKYRELQHNIRDHFEEVNWVELEPLRPTQFLYQLDPSPETDSKPNLALDLDSPFDTKNFPDIREEDATEYSLEKRILSVPNLLEETKDNEGFGFEDHLLQKIQTEIKDLDLQAKQPPSLGKKLFRVAILPLRVSTIPIRLVISTAGKIKVIVPTVRKEVSQDIREIKKTVRQIKETGAQIQQATQGQRDMIKAAASKIKSSASSVFAKFGRGQKEELKKEDEEIDAETDETAEEEEIDEIKEEEKAVIPEEEKFNPEEAGKNITLEEKRQLDPMVTKFVPQRFIKMHQGGKSSIRGTLHLQQNKLAKDLFDLNPDTDLDSDLDVDKSKPKIKKFEKQNPQYELIGEDVYLEQKNQDLVKAKETEKSAEAEAIDIHQVIINPVLLELVAEEEKLEKEQEAAEILRQGREAGKSKAQLQKEAEEKAKKELEEQDLKEREEEKAEESKKATEAGKEPEEPTEPTREELEEDLEVSYEFAQIHKYAAELEEVIGPEVIGLEEKPKVEVEEPVWFEGLDWDYVIETDEYWDQFISTPDYEVYNYDFKPASPVESEPIEFEQEVHYASHQFGRALLAAEYSPSSPEVRAFERRTSFLAKILATMLPSISHEGWLPRPDRKVSFIDSDFISKFDFLQGYVELSKMTKEEWIRRHPRYKQWISRMIMLEEFDYLDDARNLGVNKRIWAYGDEASFPYLGGNIDIATLIPSGLLLDMVLYGPSTLEQKAEWYVEFKRRLANASDPLPGFRLTDLLIGNRQRMNWNHHYFNHAFLDWWLYSSLGQTSDSQPDRLRSYTRYMRLPSGILPKKVVDVVNQDKWRGKEDLLLKELGSSGDRLKPVDMNGATIDIDAYTKLARQEFVENIDHLNFGPFELGRQDQPERDTKFEYAQQMVGTVYQPVSNKKVIDASQIDLKAETTQSSQKEETLLQHLRRLYELEHLRQLEEAGDELPREGAKLHPLPSVLNLSNLQSSSSEEETKFLSVEEYENIHNEVKLQQNSNPALPVLRDLSVAFHGSPRRVNRKVEFDMVDENGLITKLPIQLLIRTKIELPKMHALVEKLKRARNLLEIDSQANGEIQFNSNDELTILIDTLQQQIRIFSLQLLAYKKNPSLVQQTRLEALTRYLGEATQISDLESIDSTILDELWNNLELFPWAIQEDIFLLFKGLKASRQPYADATVWNYNRDRTEKIGSNPIPETEGTPKEQPIIMPLEVLMPRQAGDRGFSPFKFNADGYLVLQDNSSQIASSQIKGVDSNNLVNSESLEEGIMTMDVSPTGQSIKLSSAHVPQLDTSEIQAPVVGLDVTDDLPIFDPLDDAWKSDTSDDISDAETSDEILEFEISNNESKSDVASDNVGKPEILVSDTSDELATYDLSSKEFWQEIFKDKTLKEKVLNEKSFQDKQLHSKEKQDRAKALIYKAIQNGNKDITELYEIINDKAATKEAKEAASEILEKINNTLEVDWTKNKLDNSFIEEQWEKKVLNYPSAQVMQTPNLVDELSGTDRVLGDHLNSPRVEGLDPGSKRIDPNLEFWQELIQLWERMPLPILERVHAQAMNRLGSGHSMQDQLVRLLGEKGAKDLHNHRAILIQLRKGEWRNITFPWKQYHATWAKMRSKGIAQQRRIIQQRRHSRRLYDRRPPYKSSARRIQDRELKPLFPLRTMSPRLRPGDTPPQSPEEMNLLLLQAMRDIEVDTDRDALVPNPALPVYLKDLASFEEWATTNGLIALHEYDGTIELEVRNLDSLLKPIWDAYVLFEIDNLNDINISEDQDVLSKWHQNSYSDSESFKRSLRSSNLARPPFDVFEALRQSREREILIDENRNRTIQQGIDKEKQIQKDRFLRSTTVTAQAQLLALQKIFQQIWKTNLRTKPHPQWKLELAKQENVEEEFGWRVPLDPYHGYLDPNQLRQLSNRHFQNAYEAGMNTSMQVPRQAMMSMEIYPYVTSVDENNMSEKELAAYVEKKETDLKKLRKKLARGKFPSWVPLPLAQVLMKPFSSMPEEETDLINMNDMNVLDGIDGVLRQFQGFYVDQEDDEDKKEMEKARARTPKEKVKQKLKEKAAKKDKKNKADNESKEENDEEQEEKQYARYSLRLLKLKGKQSKIGSLFEDEQHKQEEEELQQEANKEGTEAIWAPVTGSDFKRLNLSNIREENSSFIDHKQLELMDNHQYLNETEEHSNEEEKDSLFQADQKQGINKFGLKRRGKRSLSEVKGSVHANDQIGHQIFRRASLILEHSFQEYLRDLKDDEWLFSDSLLSIDTKKKRQDRMTQMVDVINLLDYSSFIPGETSARYQQDFSSVVSPFAVHVLQTGISRQSIGNPKFSVERMPILQKTAKFLPGLNLSVRSPIDLWGARRWKRKLQARLSLERPHFPSSRDNTPVAVNMRDPRITWLRNYFLMPMSMTMSDMNMPLSPKLIDRMPNYLHARNPRRLHRYASVGSHRNYIRKHLNTQALALGQWQTSPITQFMARPRVHTIARNPYRLKGLDTSWYDYRTDFLKSYKVPFGDDEVAAEPVKQTDKAKTEVNGQEIEREVKVRKYIKRGPIGLASDIIEEEEDKAEQDLEKDREEAESRIDYIQLRHFGKVPYSQAQYEHEGILRNMAITPARRFSRKWRLWRRWAGRLPWTKLDVNWSERFYDKDTLVSSPATLHPAYLGSRIWLASIQTQILVLVFIPLIRRRVYAFAKWMKWIKLDVWSIEYLDRKGMNNKRTLEDIVGLPASLQIELGNMMFELNRKEFNFTRNIWARTEGEEDFDPEIGYRNLLPHWIRITLRRPLAYHAGAILTGPPGTGKTLLAQALAGSSRIRFIGMCSSEFLTKGVKSAPVNIGHLFDYARNHAPCLLFIDEIDTIAGVRSGHATMQNFPPFSMGSRKDLKYWKWRPGVNRRRKKAAGKYWRLKNPFWSPEPLTNELYVEHLENLEVEHWQGADLGIRRLRMNRWKRRDESCVTIQLLAEIDGCYSKSKVFVMGTTNRYSRIDAAMVRPGRIDRIIHVAPPNTRQRMEILRHYIEDEQFPIRPDQLTWSEVFFMTTGMTPADIATLVNESKVYSILQLIRLEKRLGRSLENFQYQTSHTSKSIERGVQVVTSLLSIDTRERNSDIVVEAYDPLQWSRIAYARAGRALVTTLVPYGVFVGITLFSGRPRGRKMDPIYAKLDQQAFITSFTAAQCKQAILVHLAALASKLLILQRRTSEARGLAWVDKQHTWDLELASAYAYKIVEQWSLFDPYLTLPKFILGSKVSINTAIEKRRLPRLTKENRKKMKFKAFYGPRHKGRRLGRLFKLQDSTVFQQHDYTFGMPKGEEQYIAEMVMRWWETYTEIGFLKRKRYQMQIRLTHMWPKGLKGKYRNVFWISPIVHTSSHKLRLWNQKSIYLDQRDSQVGHIMRSGFELVSKLIETYRPIIDLFVVPLLMKKKLRAKEVAKIIRPFNLNVSPSIQLIPEAGFYVEPTKLQSQPRKLERSWRLESNRFIGERQTRMIVPERVEVWNTWLPDFNRKTDNRNDIISKLRNTSKTLRNHLDIMKDSLDLLSACVQHLNESHKIEPGTVTDQNTEILVQLLGYQGNLKLPQPDRCGYIEYTNVSAPTSDFFLLTPENPNQLDVLDPIQTPAKQLQHIAIALTYHFGIDPIVRTVQEWILRWLKQDIDILDLFSFLMLFDSTWEPNVNSPYSLLHPGNVSQLLGTEAFRYTWLLTRKPQEVLWGQDVALDRVDAWSHFCSDLKSNLDTYQPSRDLLNISDPIQESLRKMLSGFEFPNVELVDEDFASSVLDLSEEWIEQSTRHTELVSALITHVNHLQVLRSEGGDDNILSDIIKALKNMTQAEQQFVQTIPKLRNHICDYVNRSVDRYYYSMQVGRLVCLKASLNLYQLRDSQSDVSSSTRRVTR